MFRIIKPQQARQIAKSHVWSRAYKQDFRWMMREGFDLESGAAYTDRYNKMVNVTLLYGTALGGATVSGWYVTNASLPITAGEVVIMSSLGAGLGMALSTPFAHLYPIGLPIMVIIPILFCINVGGSTKKKN